MSQQNAPRTTWRAWGDHPIIVTIGLIVAFIAVISFVTVAQNPQVFLALIAPNYVAMQHIAHGDTDIQHSQFEEAINEYNQAINLQPKEPAYYLLRGQAYERLREFKKANGDDLACISLSKDGLSSEPTKGTASACAIAHAKLIYLYAHLIYQNALETINQNRTRTDVQTTSTP